jgi:predicted alpha-1,2-mannosidase
MKGLRLFGMIGVLALLFSSCGKQTKDYTKLVDPFIGTGGHGHTFPGATTPFGMVQLSPDTGIEGWDWCSGYHESDESIMGFSHTHLSGTGGADYGDILLIPTVGDIKLKPGSKENPDEGYRSRFSHDDEHAQAGYYSVMLKDYDVKVELTATPRTGMHKYTFPKSSESHIIIDLQHGISDNVRESNLKIVSTTKVEGLRRSQGWANDQFVYFVAEFSKPFKTYAIAKDDKFLDGVKDAEGKNIKSVFNFETEKGEVIMVKVAISSVSTSNAWDNLKEENKGSFDFDKTRLKAKKLWNEELSKIEVEGGTKEEQVTFYTSLYHTKIHPNLFQDSNGEYRGMDMKIHTATDHVNYTLFSLWDTFRALHPLYSITDQEYNNNFIKSMLVKYQQSGKLPVWELWSNETNTMIGYHSIPVIADAILKGYGNFDKELAFKAMKESAMSDSQGLKYYKHMGYIPRELEANSVSKTVEYAFDDWCIAQVAKKLKKEKDYEYFSLRALNYRNVFDTTVKFVRGRNENGVWNPDFDPMTISLFGSGDFTEGNSWHYSFFAPHDINGMINLYGGKKGFTAKLDEMFEQEAVNDNEHAHDVTGLKGQYAQGNEPSHHVIYTYNFAGEAFKTQKLVREIMDEMYTDKPDGYSGNEDTGQMSAWYVFSSMGFYPMNPVGGQYVIGSPIFDKVTIHLANGKDFVIKANNNKSKNYYIQSAKLDGKEYNKSYFTHEMLMIGGTLEFEMGEKESNWAKADDNSPVSDAIDKNTKISSPKPLAFMPYSKDTKTIFNKSKVIDLVSETEGVQIYYTIDGSTPTEKSKLFTKAFKIYNSTLLKAISVKDGSKTSDVKIINFRKAYYNDNGKGFPKVSTDSKIGDTFNPGISTWIDGELGSNNYRDGKWTGIQGDDLKATIDLGSKKSLNRVTVNFTQNTGSWIFPPKSVKIYSSVNGKDFVEIASEEIGIPNAHLDITIKTVSLKTKVKARYIKVVAEKIGKLPSWHGGAGQDAYIFVDEITVE